MLSEKNYASAEKSERFDKIPTRFDNENWNSDYVSLWTTAATRVTTNDVMETIAYFPIFSLATRYRTSKRYISTM